MNDLISQFWLWMEKNFGKSPKEYAEKGMNQNHGEFEDAFPLFAECITYAKYIVDSDTLEADKLDDLLTIMAFDNESENVLEYIEEKSYGKQVQRIIELGVTHIQMGARWQIAELIYRTNDPNAEKLLNVLKNDPHEYVSRRAENCLSLIETSTNEVG